MTANIETIFPYEDSADNSHSTSADYAKPWNGTQTIEITTFALKQFRFYEMDANVSQWAPNGLSIHKKDFRQCMEYLYRDRRKIRT